MKGLHYYFLPLIVAAGILFFIAITFIDTMYRAKDDAGMMMVRDIEQLRDIFHRIHATCTIIDFDNQKNLINFLNVAKFAGSEVGPMNLVHPEKWEGPYLKENPTVYHHAYQVVSTKKGYFITPGDGVTLPNKKVVGKDIVLDQKAKIDEMMKDPQMLMYNNKSLAARLELGAPTNIQFFVNEDVEGA